MGTPRNAQALAEFVARTLDELDEDDELPPDAEVLDAVLIVEVGARDPEDGEPISMVQGFTMSERNVVGVGLMARGLAAYLQGD